eukprot:COSAG06_NODE_492_length_15074_cov_26.658564_2_plen_283_part_00
MRATLALAALLAASYPAAAIKEEEPLTPEEEALIRRVAREVACGFCGLLVEDMWSMTVQNAVGERIDSTVEQENLSWLAGLCRVDSPILQRFVGLYEFRRDDTPGADGRHTIQRDVPWAGDPAGEYTPSFGYIGEYEEEVAAKAERDDRQWMHRVFARLCVDVVSATDIEIAEAVAAKIRDYDKVFARLREMRETPQPGGQMDQLVTEMIADGKKSVSSDACIQTCEEFAPPGGEEEEQEEEEEEGQEQEEGEEEKEEEDRVVTRTCMLCALHFVPRTLVWP